jgi:hypothetical protein
MVLSGWRFCRPRTGEQVLQSQQGGSLWFGRFLSFLGREPQNPKTSETYPSSSGKGP